MQLLSLSTENFLSEYLQDLKEILEKDENHGDNVRVRLQARFGRILFTGK